MLKVLCLHLCYKQGRQLHVDCGTAAPMHQCGLIVTIKMSIVSEIKLIFYLINDTAPPDQKVTSRYWTYMFMSNGMTSCVIIKNTQPLLQTDL